VDVGRRYGTQGGQLCRCLFLVEQVERPIADGSTLQMRVVSSGNPVLLCAARRAGAAQRRLRGSVASMQSHRLRAHPSAMASGRPGKMAAHQSGRGAVRAFI
jgi:hypothetical protein